MRNFLVLFCALVVSFFLGGGRAVASEARCEQSPYSSGCESSEAKCKASPYSSGCESSEAKCEASPYSSGC